MDLTEEGEAEVAHLGGVWMIGQVRRKMCTGTYDALKVEDEDVLAEVENGLQLIEALCDRVSLTLAEDAKTNEKAANEF